MKTTERFEKAVAKLYTAFHEGTLDAMDCEHCAVGNLLGHGQFYGAYFIEKLPLFPRAKNTSDYSLQELSNIEAFFITGVCSEEAAFGNTKFANQITKEQVDAGFCTITRQKELQFKGLCSVIEYLCELDGIPNVMDYSSLFEYNEDNTPKKKLEEVI